MREGENDMWVWGQGHMGRSGEGLGTVQVRWGCTGMAGEGVVVLAGKGVGEYCIKASHQALIPLVETIDDRIYYLWVKFLLDFSSSAIFTVVASLFLWQWELSSLAVGTSSGSGNSITDSGNALCILFPTNSGSSVPLLLHNSDELYDSSTLKSFQIWGFRLVDMISRIVGALVEPTPVAVNRVGTLVILVLSTGKQFRGNTEDNSSTSGWVFLLGGGAISWASKKQTCITSSIMESKFVALAAADCSTCSTIIPRMCLEPAEKKDEDFASQWMRDITPTLDHTLNILRIYLIPPYLFLRWSWSRIHTPGRANDVLSYFQLWEEGLSSGGTKLILIFVTAESPEEGVRRAIPEYGATKLQKGSATSFPPNNDHPTLTFVSHTRNTPKTIKEKPSERPKLEKKPYPSPLPEQVSTPVVQQRAWSQKRRFGKQNLGTNYRGKHKSRNAKEPEQRKRVRSRTIIGMVRGDTSKKRPREQSKQWTSNKISFLSMQRCQLVDSPIILEALIKGKIFKRMKKMMERLEKRPTSNPPKKVVIHKGYHQTITIRGNLTDECRSRLIKMLRKHVDAFAWTLTDMTGISRSVAEHELKTYPHIDPRVQRKRSIAPDGRKVVKNEVTEWLKFEIVRKIRYPTWVANPVLVKKPNDSWRMGIDFKDLTKACPKELYPLPEIDWKIKSLIWLVDTIFERQMGRNLEAYVDDMVVKSKTELEMIKDVKETLMTLKKSESEKTKAVMNMPSPSNMKQIKRLSGKLAALNIFLSKATESALPCLDTLKNYTNKKDFPWTTEAEEAFQAMKKLIAELPTLTAPKKEEELVVYLSATNEALALALVHAARRLRRASREHGSGAGLILIDLEGAEYSYALQLNFANSNNNAEYEALLAGLRIATKMKVEHIHAFVDSKLVANQVEGSYEAKGKKTKKYKEKVLEIIRSFSNFQISHIPREENKKVDALSKLAAVQCEQLTKGVLIEELNERSVDMEKVNAIIEEATRT
nr:hypothetical protein [Tanacetum cinerariifolium]